MKKKKRTAQKQERVFGHDLAHSLIRVSIERGNNESNTRNVSEKSEMQTKNKLLREDEEVEI